MAAFVDALPMLTAVRDSMFLSGTVAVVDHPISTMRRVQLRGPRLRAVNWTPGQHVRVQVAGIGESLLRLRPRDTLRTYSVHHADPDVGTLDLVMFDHGRADTPAMRWGAGLSVGDVVRFTRPQGNLVVREDAPYHVFAGDETASVAFAAMLRTLPAGTEVHGVLERQTGAPALPTDHPLTHVERTGAAADSTALADGLRELRLPNHPGVAYLAGEARAVQRLRKILIDERGWGRRQIVTKPFWTPGRTGMD